MNRQSNAPTGRVPAQQDLPLAALVLIVATAWLAGCGGGGGDGGGAKPPMPSPPVYDSALDVEWPDDFGDAAPYYTTNSIAYVRGELNSVKIPRGNCPDSQPPQDFSVRWTNEATGETATVPILIGCVTNYIGGVAVSGVASVFETERFLLAQGSNRIVLDAFQGSTQIGRDIIVIVLEDNASPTISFTYPAGGATDVATNHSLLVQFSEAMNTGALTGDRFTVQDDSGATIPGQVTYDTGDRAWLFFPDAPLVAMRRYTATVAGSVEDLSGNLLGIDSAWTFETGAGMDVAALLPDKHWPESNCDCAPATTRVLVRFDDVVDPQSIDAATIGLSDGQGTVVDGTTLFRGDFLEFHYDTALQPGASYTATVAAGIRDLAGNVLSADDAWTFTVDAGAPMGSWRATSDDQPPAPMAGHTAIWTGTEVIFWGWQGGGRYDPAADAWQGIAIDNRPSPRSQKSAVWTGNEMIIWGGRDGSAVDSTVLNDGGRYDPAAQMWTPIESPPGTSSAATFNHSAIWTGTEMIVWGGVTSDGSTYSTVNTGWRYDPATDVFQPFTGTGAPAPRSEAAAIWTGNEMIIWGGIDNDGRYLADGARYDPVADAWTPLPDSASPITPSAAYSMTWTGSEAIIWNGGKTAPDQVRNDRFREATLHFYNPVTDTWRKSASGWEPFLAGDDPLLVWIAGSGYTAHWTGDRLFVHGIYPGDSGDESYLYDPIADSWQIAAPNIWARKRAAATIWAGSRFVFWGGISSVLPSDEGWVFEP